MRTNEIPVALTIAGSDSGGGAGIQADLKTFQAFGCFGTSAITAITCQNTKGVSALQGIDPDIVSGQIRAVVEDLPVKAAKTGMLFSADIIRAVRRLRREVLLFPFVVDPVMVSTSGHRLLEKDAEKEMIDFLSLATLITPNIPEAEVILGRRIENVAMMEKAAEEIAQITGTAVLLKGGHLSDDSDVTDIFYDRSSLEKIVSPRIKTKNTHGTGCTLSAAITACLARGENMETSVRTSIAFLHRAILAAPGIGSGNGPLNHMVSA